MAINSKRKGNRFELELAKKLREYGYDDARRTAQYCGKTGDASDVVGLPYIHIEAKHVERLNIYDAMAQAKRDANAGGENRLPAVFHKKNYHNVLVTMELDDFMKIYTEYEAGRAINEADTNISTCENDIDEISDNAG